MQSDKTGKSVEKAKMSFLQSNFSKLSKIRKCYFVISKLHRPDRMNQRARCGPGTVKCPGLHQIVSFLTSQTAKYTQSVDHSLH